MKKINNRLLSFKDFINENYQPILEGGAFGHLQHPFDNKSLSFDDLAEMIQITIDGSFTPENFVQAKTDGQNLMFTWKNGELRAARNKGHIKNYGEKSLTREELHQMFSGRGEIQIAFSEAVNDLHEAISKLNRSKVNKMFQEGKNFMSVEVIYPKTQNIIPYGLSMLVFHGTNTYDESGNVVDQSKIAARELANIIKEANAESQKTFFIRGPLDIKMESLPDNSRKNSYYKKKLDKVMSKYNLNSNDTVKDFVEAGWKETIENEFNEGDLSDNISNVLLNRWANSDKSYSMRLIKKEVSPEVAAKIQEFEKKKYKSASKSIMMPLEFLFLELGTDILTNIKTFLTVIPKEATEEIVQSVEKAIKDIKSGDNAENIIKLETELKRIEASGGLKNVVPTEGITFIYKGKLYKYTGLFASINQIIGILKYGR